MDKERELLIKELDKLYYEYYDNDGDTHKSIGINEAETIVKE